jgi:FAD/FMN-containing dehydrogenase
VAKPISPVTYLTPNDSGFASARALYNGGIQTQPRLIARCGTEAGVQQAVQRALENHWPIAIKSGGHCFEGYSLNDDGLVVEISALNHLQLDPKTGVLTAGAGCRLADVNRYLLTKGRFLPAGSCAAVGLAGLTLGGGYGMFARKWGLTCDHLRSVRMVAGTGEIKESGKDPELLWACKGGGNGNYGVVTEFQFDTRPAPSLFSAWKFKAFKLNETRATELLSRWFEATVSLPNDAFSAWVMNGSQVTILVTTIGNREHKGLLACQKQLATATTKNSSAGPVPIVKALPWYYGEPGPQFFKNASGGYYQGFADLRSALPGIFHEVLSVPGQIFQVNTLGGAIAEGTGAYPHRAFSYLGEQQSFWETPAQGVSRILAAGRVQGHLAKAGIKRHYVNYPDRTFADWETAYYGADNYKRLQEIKKIYDPENRIRHVQSVRLPA